MSEFQSLDDLVAASQVHSTSQVQSDSQVNPAAQDSTPSAISTRRAPASRGVSRSLSRSPRRTTKTVKKTIRLTGSPGFSSGVNQNDAQAFASEPAPLGDGESQVAMGAMVMTGQASECDAAHDSATDSAGGQAPQNPVNHAQVVVPEEFPDEIRQQLAQIGVNLRASQMGRKYVFDEFLRGRLVSLLAMGLTLRQSAAALGLSHNAIWKELRKNAELSEQVNAARFQAQIEPLLVILRASKSNWRAATWLINYLNKSLGKREESWDERGRYDKEAAREHLREQAEHYAMRQIEGIKASRRVTEELRRQ